VTAADPLEAGDAGGKVIRGGGLRAAAHVIGVLVGVISAPLVVRHLGVEDYGKFVLVTSIVYVATGLVEGGLANVAIRQYATASVVERRRLIADLLGLRLVLGVLGAAGAVAFALVAGYEEVVVASVALGGAGLLLSSLWVSLNTVLVARLRLSSVAAVEILRALATTAGLLALVIAGSGLLGFYWVAPAVALLSVVVTAVLVRRDAPLLPSFDGPRWKELLRETAVYAAASALGAIYFQVALVMTSLLTDDRETGLFGIAFRIVDLANGVPYLLAGSLFPVLAHAAANDRARLGYVVGRATEAALAAGGWFGVALVLGAPFAIEVVAGSSADGSVPVLRILGVGVVATFLVASWSFTLLALQRYKELIAVNGGALVLAVVLSLVLVPELGAQGSAIVTATLEVGLATSYGVVIARREPALRPAARLAGPILLAAAAAFAVGLPLELLHPVPAVIVGTAAYFGVLAALRAIPSELLDALPVPFVKRRA